MFQPKRSACESVVAALRVSARARAKYVGYMADIIAVCVLVAVASAILICMELNLFELALQAATVAFMYVCMSSKRRKHRAYSNDYLDSLERGCFKKTL